MMLIQKLFRFLSFKKHILKEHTLENYNWHLQNYPWENYNTLED